MGLGFRWEFARIDLGCRNGDPEESERDQRWLERLFCSTICYGKGRDYIFSGIVGRWCRAVVPGSVWVVSFYVRRGEHMCDDIVR